MMDERNDRFSRDEFDNWDDGVDRRWRDDEPYRRVRHEAQEAIRRAGASGGRRKSHGFAFMKSIPKPVLVVAALVLGVATAVLATYLLVSHVTAPAPAANPQTPPAAAPAG